MEDELENIFKIEKDTTDFESEILQSKAKMLSDLRAQPLQINPESFQDSSRYKKDEE